MDDKNDNSISDGSLSDEYEVSEDGETSENENSVPGLKHIAKNGTKYKYRNVPRVIRYNLKKDLANHYRELLMLCMPWRNEQIDLLGPFKTNTAHYNSIKISLEAKHNDEHHTEELELARQMMESEELHMMVWLQMQNKKTEKH